VAVACSIIMHQISVEELATVHPAVG